MNKESISTNTSNETCYTPLTFEGLRRANLARVRKYKNSKGELTHPRGVYEWSPEKWLQALLGEIGEYANIRKKWDRGDISYDEFQKAASEELADVQTYLDLLSCRLDINLGDATIRKFNEVSRRVGADVFLGGEITTEHPKITISQSAGISAVLGELARHNALGYTTEHDRKVNAYGELVCAAICVINNSPFAMPKSWNMEVFKKISSKPRAEQLAIAASLLIAEINRIS